MIPNPWDIGFDANTYGTSDSPRWPRPVRRVRLLTGASGFERRRRHRARSGILLPISLISRRPSIFRSVRTSCPVLGWRQRTWPERRSLRRYGRCRCSRLGCHRAIPRCPCTSSRSANRGAVPADSTTRWMGSGDDVLLAARAECYHVGAPEPLRDAVRRLQALPAAGADVLFAPRPQDPVEIEAPRRGGSTKAAQPSRGSRHWPECRRHRGARRATHQRWRRPGAEQRGPLFMRAAQALRSTGSFAGSAGLVPYAEINGLFATDRSKE